MSHTPASAAPAAPLNVLFSVRPFRGHLHPLIPLARAFRLSGSAREPEFFEIDDSLGD